VNDEFGTIGKEVLVT